METSTSNPQETQNLQTFSPHHLSLSVFSFHKNSSLMETSTSNPPPPPQETQNHSPINSINNNGSSSSSSSSTTPPLTPKSISISRSEPTTFVQADTNNFKQVVQMLTGSSETTAKQTSKTTTDHTKGLIPPIKTGQKKQSFKLYERRNNLKNGLIINPLIPYPGQNSRFSPRKMELLSPSILDFPALVLSPVTPLIEDPFNKSPTPTLSSIGSSEEEKAIAQKKFYLHPSPRTTTGSGPQLLPLFPLTSPRLSFGFSS